jgi:hypothetical protein
MLAPAVAAGKGVKGERECCHCLRIEASDAANIARGEDLNGKKVLAQKIFGSNLILSDKKARGDALIPWAALRAAPPTRGWELLTYCYTDCQDLSKNLAPRLFYQIFCMNWSLI